jgi:hypothetical protein
MNATSAVLKMSDTSTDMNDDIHHAVAIAVDVDAG